MNIKNNKKSKFSFYEKYHLNEMFSNKFESIKHILKKLA